MINGVDWFWATIIIAIVFSSVSGMYAARQSRIKAIQQARTPPDLRLCSCGHGVGMHGEDPCSWEVKRPTFTEYSYDPRYEWVRCGCRRFDGLDSQAVLEWRPPNELR
jgi:hypothetical protein